MLVEVVCPHCGVTATKEVGAVNRARRLGYAVYCSRTCSGLARRLERSGDELRSLKAAYDVEYRARNLETIRQKKAARFQRTYDPSKAREHRKARMPYHVEYCRRYYADPVKKQEKVEYDIRVRGAQYADYFEAWRLLIELEREIRTRLPDKYERAKARGYYDKFKERNDGRENRQHA